MEWRALHALRRAARRRALETLLRPGDGIDTVMSADAYGAGEADRVLGRALEGVDRESYCLIGAIGHDFYEGEREGAKGFPRFTDPRLRGDARTATTSGWPRSAASSGSAPSASTCCCCTTPTRSATRVQPCGRDGGVRDAGLTRSLGVAPGPANGFTLDLIGCIESFGGLIDWAMIILSPMEPWPGELVLGVEPKHEVQLITRVVDYGGLFHDDVAPGHVFAEYDHRKLPPRWAGSSGQEKLERMRPYAERHGLSLLQLACQWNLAHPAVRCVAPTLIQESGKSRATPARPIEDKRAELAALPADLLLDATEVDELRAIGDNTGSMALKGANPAHEGEPRPDRWGMSDELAQVAARWEIAPEHDLAQLSQAPAA